MSELASKMQLRMSFLRWVLFIVPMIVLLGAIAGQLSGSGEENRWFQALTKPDAQPPGWAFAVVWPFLYALTGIAVTLVVTARGARLRALGIMLFFVQLVLTFLWSPVFFGMHQVTTAFYLLVAIFVLATATTMVFGRVRSFAAWLMVPYLAWLCFAAVLNKQIDELNPGAETLIVPQESQRIALPPSN